MRRRHERDTLALHFIVDGVDIWHLKAKMCAANAIVTRRGSRLNVRVLDELNAHARLRHVRDVQVGIGDPSAFSLVWTKGLRAAVELESELSVEVDGPFNVRD